MHRSLSTRRIVEISFLVDLLDIITNLFVYLFTGSTVIFAEMIQGLVDSIGSFLLIIGQHKSRRPSDPLHPFGHSRSVFFWALVSSMVMLTLGSGFAIWRGYQQLIHPFVLQNIWLAYIVLFIAISSNGYAFYQSYKKIHKQGVPFLRAFNESSQQLVKTALLRDSLGTLSAIIGLLSVTSYSVFGFIEFDAIGAIIIGVFVALFAIALITQSEHFISGLSVPAGVKARIRMATLKIPEVVQVNKLAAVYIGTEQILVDIDVKLHNDLTTPHIEQVLDRIKEVIMQDVPEARSVQIDLNSPEVKEEFIIRKN